MKKKINVAELLRNCPQGMELDCIICENLYFDYISNDKIYPIWCYIEDNLKAKHPITFTWYGQSFKHDSAKCVIFPKGETTWEGFIPPCKFKDGDIISDSLGTCIFKREGRSKGTIDYYCGIHTEYFMVKDNERNPEGHYGWINDYRLATEEEKERLFQAIKDNGYRWNSETKTLEKLVEPIFKVGDVIQNIDSYKVKITEVNIEDECYGYESVIAKGLGGIRFNEQDEWKLVPNKFDITTLKPFDKVLVRTKSFTSCWTIDFFDGYQPERGGSFTPFGVTGGKYFQQCIPYEGNEHLRATINDCDEFYKTWEE